MLISILIIAVLVSALIFVHELGHFLAAKLAGVRVLKFYLGFDIPIRLGSFSFGGSLLSVQIGETRYGIGWLFFGGYVKMQGQEDLQPLVPGAVVPGDYRSAAPPRRLLIALGGVIMNAIFAFVFVIAAFWIGVRFPEPVVGAVPRGGVAWQAGLQPGDRFLEVGHQRVLDFSDVPVAVATAHRGERVRVVVERAGQTHELALLPVYSTSLGGRFAIQVDPTHSRGLDVLEGGAAWNGGLQDGDLLVAWRPGGDTGSFRPYDPTRGWVFTAFLESHPGGDVELQVQRGGEILELAVTLGAQPGTGRIGVAAPSDTGLELLAVRGALPGLPDPLGEALQARDRIETVGGQQVVTGSQVLEALGRSAGEMELTLHPWWARLTGPEMDALLQAFSHEASSQSPEDRRRYLSGALDQLVVDEHPVLGWLARAFARRPLGDRQVAELELTLQLARLGSTDALRDETVLARAREAAALRGGQLELTSAEGSVRPLLRLRLDAETCRAACPDLRLTRAGLLFDGRPALPESAPTGLLLTQLVPWGPVEEAGLPVPFLLTGMRGNEGTLEGPDWETLVTFCQDLPPGSTVTLRGRPLREDGALDAELEVSVELRPVGQLGIAWHKPVHAVSAAGLEAVRLGVGKGVSLFRSVLAQVRAMASLRMSPRNVGGPIAIATVSYTALTDYGLGYLVFICAVISMSLAIINLFPLPPFDGGLVVLTLYEWVWGRPPAEGCLLWYFRLGLLVLAVLIVFVFWNDLSRIIG